MDFKALRQKNEQLYNEYSLKAKEYGFETIYTSIQDINFKIFKEHKNDIEINVLDEEQITITNKKLAWIRSICSPGKFIWTPSGGLSKIPCNQEENKYEIIKIDGYGKRQYIVAYIKVLGWILSLVHMPYNEDTIEDKVKGTTNLKKLIDNCPEILKYKNEDIAHTEEVAMNMGPIFYNSQSPTSFSRIWSEDYKGQRIINHVYSIDINSDYADALRHIIPETEEYIEQLFLHRKENKNNKAILNTMIGTMYSQYTKNIPQLKVPYALADLSYLIHDFVCKKILNMTYKLEQQGATILMLCTDSIKFIWPYEDLPTGIDVGPGLGQWKYEFKDTQFCFLGVKKYQYIGTEGENKGVHKVVLSGRSKLEQFKKKEDWDWDDLFGVEIRQWKLNPKTLQIELCWTKGE